MRTIIFFASILLIISCNSKEKPADIHSAYWIETSSDSLKTVNVFQFYKDNKEYSGKLFILEKESAEKSFVMQNLDINDNLINFEGKD